MGGATSFRRSARCFMKVFAMESSVRDHYQSVNLIEKIDAGLTAAKKNPERIDIRDLAPVDQLHTGGIRGTEALLKKLGISPHFHVMDAGCGLGGASRLMADTFGCRVTGIDLSPDYIETARVLTVRTGLADRVQFETGSILALPEFIGPFDMILCQHILMNISDKHAAVRQFARQLKPGGTVVLHEIVSGSHPGMAFPVPGPLRRISRFWNPGNRCWPVSWTTGSYWTPSPMPRTSEPGTGGKPKNLPKMIGKKQAHSVRWDLTWYSGTKRQSFPLPCHKILRAAPSG